MTGVSNRQQGQWEAVMGYFLGIDGGASKTVCLIETKDGRIVGRGFSGPANYLKVGILTAKLSIRDAVKDALSESGASKAEIESTCAGIAGVYRERDREIMSRVLREFLPQGTLVLESDAFVTLTGATGGRPGVVVIAGTGSIAFGMNSQGERARAGGWGHVLGDEGSGYDIARRGLIAALRDFDERGPRTCLREALTRELYLSSIEEVIPLLYSGQLSQKNLAALYPLVLSAAEAEDPVALGLLEEAAEELSRAAGAVLRKLNEPAALPVVMWGGAFQNGPRLRTYFKEALSRRSSGFVFREPEQSPEFGALLVARKALREKSSG